MRALIFDTETTGIDPNNGHVVQLAFILHNTDNGVDELRGNFIRTPADWEIPKEASDVHGISTAMAKQLGLPMDVILNTFTQAILACDIVVGHNVKFDVDFITNEYREVLEQNNGWPVRFDTMQKNIEVCKVPLSDKQVAAQDRHKNADGTFDWSPPDGWPKYRYPNLTATYKHYFGTEFDNAHDAMADVEATKAIFLKMQEGDNDGEK